MSEQSGAPETPETAPAASSGGTVVPDLSGAEREAATVLFGDRLPLAQRYVEHLCTTGIEHGLVGPREVERIWARHVLNCAIVGTQLAPGTTVADVGSGSGLPGVTLALVQPAAEVILIEPMERRVDWLDVVIKDLGLENVQVIRARAEEAADEVMADVVTARAVSALKKLIPMTVPLLDDDGQLLLIKGRSAAEEIEAAQKTIKKHRLRQPTVEVLGEDLLAEPTTVVRARRS